MRRSRHRLALLPAGSLVLATACATAGAGGGGGSVPVAALRLPTAAKAAAMAKPLRANADVAATFVDTDSTLGDGTRYHVWRVDAAPGRRSTIRLASAQFKPYLLLMSVVGDSLEVVGTNQPRDGGLAHLSFEAVDRGPFYVIANATRAEDRGEYSLRAGTYEAPSLHIGRVPPAEIRRLERANTVSSALDADDRTLRNDESRFELWRFSGRKGDRLGLRMESTEFRPFLAWGRIAGDSLLVEDEGAVSEDGKEALAVIELERDGEYVVIANGNSPSDVGRYTLRLEPLEAQRFTVAASAREKLRTLTLGVPQEGELTSADAALTDGTRYQLWKLEGRAGESIMVTMESRAVDAYLYIGTLDGDVLRVLKSNDDRGFGGDARVRLTLPRTGSYVVVANVLEPDDLGPYRIVLERNRGAIRLP